MCKSKLIYLCFKKVTFVPLANVCEFGYIDIVSRTLTSTRKVTMKNNKKELINELEQLYCEIDSNDDIDFMTPPFYDCYPQTIKEIKEEIQLCKDILSGKITKYTKQSTNKDLLNYRKILEFCN